MKDTSAIYGVQAANGVIVITTKQGKKGEKTHINYSGIVSWASPVVKRQYVNAYEHIYLAIKQSTTAKIRHHSLCFYG
ncbi:MAG: hypothetical protein ACLULH_10865 [Bacteroides fragilis]